MKTLDKDDDLISKNFPDEVRIVIECPHCEEQICGIGTQYLNCHHPKATYKLLTNSGEFYEGFTAICVTAEKVMAKTPLPRMGAFMCPMVVDDKFARGIQMRKI